jgi:hypothetical protein
MIGPPFLKLSTKKFLSNALSGTAGVAAGVGVPPAVVVVVAGDIAVVAGVVPAIGDNPGAVAAGATGLVPVTEAPGAGGTAGLTAGLTAAGLTAVVVVGGAPGGRLAGAFGGAGGGDWPNEVSAKVTEQRLAISSVFIGWIGKLSRARISMSLLSSMR